MKNFRKTPGNNYQENFFLEFSRNVVKVTFIPLFKAFFGGRFACQIPSCCALRGGWKVIRKKKSGAAQFECTPQQADRGRPPRFMILPASVCTQSGAMENNTLTFLFQTSLVYDPYSIKVSQMTFLFPDPFSPQWPSNADPWQPSDQSPPHPVPDCLSAQYNITWLRHNRQYLVQPKL